MLRSLRIICDYALMLVDAYYAQNCAGIMYASLIGGIIINVTCVNTGDGLISCA